MGYLYTIWKLQLVYSFEFTRYQRVNFSEFSQIWNYHLQRFVIAVYVFAYWMPWMNWNRWLGSIEQITSNYYRFNRHHVISFMALQWLHNGLDGVSIHQPHHCLLSRLFGRRSKKTSKLRVTGLCVGNSPGTGEFPAQMASNAENVSIWWRYQGMSTTHKTGSTDYSNVIRIVRELIANLLYNSHPLPLRQRSIWFIFFIYYCV